MCSITSIIKQILYHYSQKNPYTRTRQEILSMDKKGQDQRMGKGDLLLMEGSISSLALLGPALYKHTSR